MNQMDLKFWVICWNFTFQYRFKKATRDGQVLEFPALKLVYSINIWIIQISTTFVLI